MTTASKIIAAFALVCLSAPAFAHGHAGGMSGNQTSQHDDRSTNHDQTTTTNQGGQTVKLIPAQQLEKMKAAQKFNMLTPLQQLQLQRQVGASLGTLINTFAADLKAGNKGAAAMILREIARLSATTFKDGFSLALSAGSGHTVQIGNLPNGQFVLDGKVVRI